MQRVKCGDTVLLVWFSTHSPDTVSSAAEDLRLRVGDSGRVLLENVERLALGQKMPQNSQN